MSVAKITWFQWPNVLAADAACIAVVWQLALARTFSLRMHWAETVVLGLSVWLTYMGDRWLDARSILSFKTQRHHFAHTHSQILIPIWTTLLIGNLTVACIWLQWADLLRGFGLLTLCIVYTVALRIRWFSRHIPKELLVAGIFSSGLGLFFVEAPIAHRGVLYTLVLTFGLLVLLNCTLLAKAEIAIDRDHGDSSFVQQWPRLTQFIRKWLICTVFIAAFAIGQQQLAWAVQLILIASIYLYLEHRHNRIHPEYLRILTDSILLLPVSLLLL